MRLLIADDHKLIIDTFTQYLKSWYPEIDVIPALTIQEVIDGLSGPEPVDLVLLDLIIPGANGFEGVKSICEQFSGVPVVVMSGIADSHEVIAEALACGAAGFVTKDMSGRALVMALELVMAGETFVPSKFLAQSEHAELDPVALTEVTFEPENPLSRLTARERDVVAQLVHGKSNKEIADVLGLSDGTIAFHLRQLSEKLGAANRTQIVAIALTHGWRVE